MNFAVSSTLEFFRVNMVIIHQYYHYFSIASTVTQRVYRNVRSGSPPNALHSYYGTTVTGAPACTRGGMTTSRASEINKFMRVLSMVLPIENLSIRTFNSWLSIGCG